MQIIGEARVADLKPGDRTQCPAIICTCEDLHAPWRVEKLDPIGPDGIYVTWSHPPCGYMDRPWPCRVDYLVTVWE